MKRKTSYRGALAACGLSLVVAALCMDAAVAAPVTGADTVTLSYVFATLQTGQQDQKPEDIAACRKQVSAPGSKYLGSAVTTKYSIDVQSKMMSASSSLPSPGGTQPMTVTIPLAPLGLSGSMPSVRFGRARCLTPMCCSRSGWTLRGRSRPCWFSTATRPTTA